jgi:hypothetical protein
MSNGAWLQGLAVDAAACQCLAGQPNAERQWFLRLFALEPPKLFDGETLEG